VDKNVNRGKACKYRVLSEVIKIAETYGGLGLQQDFGG